MECYLDALLLRNSSLKNAFLWDNDENNLPGDKALFSKMIQSTYKCGQMIKTNIDWTNQEEEFLFCLLFYWCKHGA